MMKLSLLVSGLILSVVGFAILLSGDLARAIVFAVVVAVQIFLYKKYYKDLM